MEAIVLSCNNFLLLSALFLLKVVSISKSRGTRLPVRDLCIQNTDKNNGYPIQEENKYKQKKIFTSNKRVTNRHLKNELNFPNRKRFPDNGARNLVKGRQVYRITSKNLTISQNLIQSSARWLPFQAQLSLSLSIAKNSQKTQQPLQKS